MKQLALFIACIFTLNLGAQKFGISLESGPSFGILKKDLTDAAFEHNTRYSMGSGIANNLLFHLYPDSSNWYFTAGFELYQSNQITCAYMDSDSGGLNANSRTLNSLRFQTQLAYSFTIGRFKLDLRAGFLLPIYNASKEYQYQVDTSYNALTIMKLGNFPSLGFKGGAVFSGKLSNTMKIRWFLNLDLSLMNSKVKTAKVTEYKDSEGGTLESKYPNTASQEILYRKDPTLIRNNEAVLPARFDQNQATDKLSYSQSLSSINIKLGFIFQF